MPAEPDKGISLVNASPVASTELSITRLDSGITLVTTLLVEGVGEGTAAGVYPGTG